MNNYRQPGDTVTLTAPRALASGAGFLSGSIFAVAMTAAAAGARVEGRTTGVVTLPKAAVAITEGALLYWDNAAFNLTTVAGGNKLVGAALTVQAAGDASVTIRLNGAFTS